MAKKSVTIEVPEGATEKEKQALIKKAKDKLVGDYKKDLVKKIKGAFKK